MLVGETATWRKEKCDQKDMGSTGRAGGKVSRGEERNQKRNTDFRSRHSHLRGQVWDTFQTW